MLWVLKWTVSFEHPKNMLQLMDKGILTFLLSKFVFIIITWTTNVAMMEMLLLLLILMMIIICLSQSLDKCPQKNGSSCSDTTQCPHFSSVWPQTVTMTFWDMYMNLEHDTSCCQKEQIISKSVIARIRQNVPCWHLTQFCDHTSDIWIWSCVWHIVLPITFCAKRFIIP